MMKNISVDIKCEAAIKIIERLQQITEKEHRIPGAVQYSVKRYERLQNVVVEDAGIIKYKCGKQKSRDNYLELKFCVAGNIYCKEQDCGKCGMGNAKPCEESIPSFDVLTIRYSAAQLSQFIKQRTAESLPADALLTFNTKNSFEKNILPCCKTKTVIEGLLSHKYSGSLENIYVNAQLQMLLLFCMDCLSSDSNERYSACKFLSNEWDRSKIIKAREILLQHIGEPITIKGLSRKVAINECYLKKGFKEMYGTTIFDFYQSQRMEHAKYLLYEKGLNVTDVSAILGYSSISHFSTAFKKQTGLKPCELLLR